MEKRSEGGIMEYFFEEPEIMSIYVVKVECLIDVDYEVEAESEEQAIEIIEGSTCSNDIEVQECYSNEFQITDTQKKY